MAKLIKRIFCKHDYAFRENIYGDKINHISSRNKTYRSIWICRKCGKVQKREYLNRVINNGTT